MTGTVVGSQYAIMETQFSHIIWITVYLLITIGVVTAIQKIQKSKKD